MGYTYEDLRNMLNRMAELTPDYLDKEVLELVNHWPPEKLMADLPGEVSEALRYLGAYVTGFGRTPRVGPIHLVDRSCFPS